MTALNQTGIRALRSALSNVQDNLYRYRHFVKPDALDGNGRPFSEAIAALERDEKQLRHAIAQAEDAS